jgi:hypothetical protein
MRTTGASAWRFDAILLASWVSTINIVKWMLGGVSVVRITGRMEVSLYSIL